MNTGGLNPAWGCCKTATWPSGSATTVPGGNKCGCTGPWG